MKPGKIIAGVAVGAVVALLIYPKSRKMIIDAISQFTDSLKNALDSANDLAQDVKDETSTIADKATNLAETLHSAKSF